MELSNKNVFVTGSTRGIGLAIAHKFASLGANVVLNGRSAISEELLAQFADYGVKVVAISGDVSDNADAKRMVDEAVAALGSVDILINNAGITKDGMLHKMPEENWHAVIETNLTSCFNMCRAVIAGMRERTYGRIINISSINGAKGQAGQTNYSAAKAGMHGFSKALAQELASKGVTVNTVSPGYVGTDMVRAIREDVLEKIVATIPVKRLGEPKEIASMVSWLASNEGGYATGAEFSVNGGQHMQ